jgi:hypothetical protein
LPKVTSERSCLLVAARREIHVDPTAKYAVVTFFDFTVADKEETDGGNHFWGPGFESERKDCG